MKKRILISLIIVSLLGVLAGGLLDLNTYGERSKTIPREEGKLVFSITTYDGKTESEPFLKCLGHTWLSLENRTGHPVALKDYEIADGESVTFSVWAISGHCGVYFNLESAFITQCGRYVGRQTLSTDIDEEKLPVIEDYIDGNDRWTFTENCSCWSVRLWNTLADENCRLKTQTLIYTPERLQRSFCEFDCVETDKSFAGAGEIFCYRDGVRTELKLCL